MAEDAGEPKVSFKVKTSSGGESNRTITMAETKTVLDLKQLLATEAYENISADRQRLIYSGRVMKNEEPLSTYKIKDGNTIHMVKSAPSNSQNPATSTASPSNPAAGVPTNMAAGTANNPLAGLTGARYAGQVQLPGMDMFGPDAGMGAPPTEDDIADQMMNNPNMAQMMNQALQNPAMIDMMIASNPQLRAMGPEARQMLQSPMFRQMMTDPNMLRQAAAMRRQMQGGSQGGSFPAPGVTDTTPVGPDSNDSAPASTQNPLGNFLGGRGAGNPFAMFGQPGGAGSFNTSTPASAPEAPPASASNTASANPFGALFSPYSATSPVNSGTGPFGMTPEQLQQAMQMAQQMTGGTAGETPSIFNMNPDQMRETMQMAQQMGLGTGTFGSEPMASAAPADTRPPEEVYSEQLRALNDMGFFDFEANVQALRRSGGNVQGAINSLLDG